MELIFTTDSIEIRHNFYILTQTMININDVKLCDGVLEVGTQYYILKNFKYLYINHTKCSLKSFIKNINTIKQLNVD